MSEYSFDMGRIDSPVQMLTVMAFTLGSLAGVAKDAATQFLNGEKASASSAAQLMVGTAGTVGAFLWPLSSRRKKLAEAFPRRGQDLQELFGVDENGLGSLRLLRDSMIHLDERIEEFWLSTPEGQLSMWAVTEDPVPGGNFMSWNPVTEEFSFLDHSLSVRELVDLLALIEKRAVGVMFKLLKYEDVPDDAVEPSGTEA